MAAPLIAAAGRSLVASGGGLGAATGISGGGGSSALAGLNADLISTSNASGKLGSALGDLNGMFGRTTGVSGVYGQTIGRLTGAMEAAYNTARRLTDQYVKVFAPAEANLFHQAIRDLNATIGEQLVPVTRAARDVIRFFADGLATFTPVIRGFFEDVIGTVKPAFLVLGETFKQLMPIISSTAQLLGEIFVKVLESVVDSIVTVTQWFNRLIREFNALFGIREWQMADSRGKAYAPAQTTTAAGMLTKLQQNAFGMGREDPQVRSVNILDKIREYFLDGKFVEDATNAFVNAVNELPGVKQVGQARDFVANNLSPQAVARKTIEFGADLLRQVPRFDF